jgi:radical SAM protein with 4Fe4S-binding SPASM domain
VSEQEPRADGPRGGGFSGVRSPSGLVYVVWEITLRCDLACGHCGSRAGRARPDELSTEEALGVVAELAALGASEITLIGGEAYLRPDFPVLARAIADSGMRCAVTTGGRAVDAARAREMREAGVAQVSVSIDGLARAHDVQRGLAGSFAAATRALAVLADAGVSVSVNTQLNRWSFPDLDAIYTLAHDHRAESWQVQHTVPMGRAAERPGWLFQPWEILVVHPKLAELALRGASEARPMHLWPANNIGYFGPHEAAIRGRGVHEDRAWGGCIAGKHALGLESDGTVKGCPSLPTADWAAGSVRTHTLAELWETSATLRRIRDRKEDDVYGRCADCYYAKVCRGGCTWTAHVFFGRHGNNPYCHHRATTLREQGLRERLVPVAPAPGVVAAPFDHRLFELVEEPFRDDELYVAPPEHHASAGARGRALPVVS